MPEASLSPAATAEPTPPPQPPRALRRWWEWVAQTLFGPSRTAARPPAGLATRLAGAEAFARTGCTSPLPPRMR